MSQAPTVAAPAPAALSIDVHSAQPSTQPGQASNVSEESWNEIAEFGDSEDFFFMISDSNTFNCRILLVNMAVLLMMTPRFRLLIIR